MRQGEIADALASCREAARLDPGHPGPPALMGSIYLEAGRYAEAEASLRLATRGDPVLFRDIVTRALEDLGRVYMRTARPELAHAVLTKALQLEPDRITSIFGASVAALRLGRVAEARRGFERVLALDPGNAAATAYLGEIAEHTPR
jgi:Flp pilus assembly protein TadD